MAFGKRVLFVQPDTDLTYARKEAENVINLLEANVLQGSVHVQDLMDRVRIFQPHLIVFSAHGTEDGILLSDGIVGAELLKPIISMSDVECVYLNTCDSIGTATKIHNELPVFFIFNVAEVPDQSAFVSMSAFAYHLNNGVGYQRAWFLAKSAGNSELLFLPDMTEPNMPKEPQEKPIGINEKPKLNGNGRLENLHDEVVQLGYLVYGNERWKLPGLINTVTNLQRDVSFIKTAVWLLVLLVFLMLIGGVLIWLQG